jgi:hypothetical protein
MSATRVSRLSGTTFGNLNILQNDYFIVTTTGAATATLPNGYEGQKIYILLVVDGGNLVVSGDFETGTTATFADAKDAVELLWISDFGWMTISNQGIVAFA